MVATIVVQGVLTWLQRYFLLRLETKLALSTSSRFFNHILRLPAAYFGQRFAGEIGSRVQINDKVASVIGGKLATTTIDSVMTIFYATLMWFYDSEHDDGRLRAGRVQRRSASRWRHARGPMPAAG